MNAQNQPGKKMRIISWIMSGIVILFMTMDALGKFFKPQEVIDGTLALGYAEHHIALIGILGLIPTLLYLLPRTTLLGLILLTAYYGGVVATHIRMDAPLFSHILFPVYLAVLAWGGLWLRDVRVKQVFPLMKPGN